MHALTLPPGTQQSPVQCASKDDSFGPSIGSCRGGFDFTLFFEETILFILPLVLFLLVASFRLAYLARRQIKVIPSLLLWLKHVRYAKKLSQFPS